MSDVMQGPGWWLASDGKWYPPELRESTSGDLVSPDGATEPRGEGWWFASDGKWYPPAMHPDALKAEAEKPRRAGLAQASSERQDRPAARSEERGGARLDRDEASLFRRYVGFVPELGPEPEIRAALRDPLPEPALVTSERPKDNADPSSTADNTQALSGSTEDELSDIEWGDWDAWEASKPDDVPNQPRGPRHAKGRRWLR